MSELAEGRYVRSVLVEVLVYHYATRSSGCGCGWAELGHSHPEHVADVYEASVLASASVSAVTDAEPADDSRPLRPE